MEFYNLELGNKTSRLHFNACDALFNGLDEHNTVVLVDQNTDEVVTPFIPTQEYNLRKIVLPAGERCKDLDTLKTTLSTLLDWEVTRDATVVGAGGGAVTDLAGMVSNLYLRGIRLVLIPTTLLAMVDAALGGKTGINFGRYKNMVGTFYPASEVRICSSLLTTLPEREFRSGLAEVIKAAMLGDAELMTLLEDRSADILARNPGVLSEMIYRSVMVKVRHVEEDFTERGIRVHLNLGHTFGHALESAAGLGAYSHGEAVAWGIGRALELGEYLGITDREYALRSRTLLEKYGFDLALSGYSESKLIAAIYHDKKRNRNGLRFILQTGPQKTEIRQIEENIVRSILV